MSNKPWQTFTIKSIAEEDKERVLQFVRQYFYGDEPLNEYLERESTTQPNTNNNYGLEAVCKLKEGLSIMALSPSNEIVGVAINNCVEAKAEAQGSPLKISSNIIKIMNLFNELVEQMGDLAKLQNASEKEMDAYMLSVHPEWRGKGIGRALLEHTRVIAKQNGFNQIRCICSSAYTAMITEKMGFSCVHSIKYEDYKVDGEVVFKPKAPHTHVKAMILRI